MFIAFHHRPFIGQTKSKKAERRNQQAAQRCDGTEFRIIIRQPGNKNYQLQKITGKKESYGQLIHWLFFKEIKKNQQEV